MKHVLRSSTNKGVLAAAIFHEFGKDLYLAYDGTQSVQLLEKFFNEAQGRLDKTKSTLHLDDDVINRRLSHVLVSQYYPNSLCVDSKVESISSIDIVLSPVSVKRPVVLSPNITLDNRAFVLHLQGEGYLDLCDVPTSKCNDGGLSAAFKRFFGSSREVEERETYRQFCTSFQITDFLEYTKSGVLEINTTPVHLRTLKDLICLNFSNQSYWEDQEMPANWQEYRTYSFCEKSPSAVGKQSVEAIKLMMVGAETDVGLVRRRFIEKTFSYDV